MKANVNGEVRVAMMLRKSLNSPQREVFRRFDHCEDAWFFMSREMHVARNRRNRADREEAVYGYYYGITSTGKTYGGMHIINGEHVRPQDNDHFRGSTYAGMWYEKMDSDINMLKQEAV